MNDWPPWDEAYEIRQQPRSRVCRSCAKGWTKSSIWCVAGATAAGPLCGRRSGCPSGSQLEEAVGVLRAHAGSVAFITINIGVNDVLNACLDDAAGALDPTCARGLLPEVQANLAAIIRTLGDAAPGVPIAGMSYWDPFLGFWITGPEGEVRARTSNQAMQVLNAGLISTYRGEGAFVADVAGPAFFDIADFSRLVASRWGLVPVNVANACTWTWFCARPPLGPDPHPNTRGYRVIADAFAAVLPSNEQLHRKGQGTGVASRS